MYRRKKRICEIGVYLYRMQLLLFYLSFKQFCSNTHRSKLENKHDTEWTDRTTNTHKHIHWDSHSNRQHIQTVYSRINTINDNIFWYKCFYKTFKQSEQQAEIMHRSNYAIGAKCKKKKLVGRCEGKPLEN